MDQKFNSQNPARQELFGCFAGMFPGSVRRKDVANICPPHYYNDSEGNWLSSAILPRHNVSGEATSTKKDDLCDSMVLNDDD